MISRSKFDITISPGTKAPEKAVALPSKSELHRLLIASALSDKPTRIECFRSMRSEDIDATADCLASLGAKITFSDTYIDVVPIKNIPDSPVLNCRESGSTLRFMLPIAASLGANATFVGTGRLPDRPLADLIEVMKAHGITFSANKLPFTLGGRLSAGKYQISGKVSSQYVTGLLFALATLPAHSEIKLTSPLESAAYVDITCDVLGRFGVNIAKSENGYSLIGQKPYTSPKIANASGDWSNISYFLASGALFAPIRVSNLDLLSSQGDMKILEILADFGSDIEINEGDVLVSPNEKKGISVDLSQIPDLLPTLAALAVFADGESTFYGGARLRLKESDRIKSVAAMVNSLGGEAIELPDGLIVKGKAPIGGVVDSFRDHRIVMAASLISLGCEKEVKILGADAVNKSYPTFFKEFGIKI